MKTKNITFVSHAGRELVCNQCVELNILLARLQSTLSENSEATLEQAMLYQANPSYKRDEVLKGCEEYIAKSGMPEYLQEDTRQRAYHSCDNEYVEKLQALFDSLPLSFKAGDIIEKDGKWVVSQTAVEKLTEKYTYTLTNEEMADFELYTQLVALATRLRKKNYFFDSRNLTPCDTEEQLAERFVRGRIATIEEISQRAREIGL